MRSELGHEVVALALQQAGVIATRQLAALGVRGNAVTRAVRRGQLHPWHRGIYTIAPRPLLPRTAKVWAASLLGGERAAVSHRAAAGWLLLLDGFPGPVDVSVPGDRTDVDGVRFHRPRLAAADVWTHEGVRVTSPHRTLLDLAETEPDRVNKALANADFHDLLDFDALEATMARFAHHRGVRPLRQAMQLHHPGFARTKSGLEDAGLLLVLRAGLPAPHVNTDVCGHEVDLWWPRERLVVEWDGPRNRTASQRRIDRARDAWLEAHGITVRRFDEDDVYARPRATVATSVVCSALMSEF